MNHKKELLRSLWVLGARDVQGNVPKREGNIPALTPQVRPSLGAPAHPLPGDDVTLCVFVFTSAEIDRTSVCPAPGI